MDEAYQIGLVLAEKLNQATGPTVLCIPLRGWGALDMINPDKELGWAGPDPAPMWCPDPEHPAWSRRNGHLIQALRETLDLQKSNLDVLLVDKHLNESGFADMMAELLDEMLSGTWAKGSHHDLSCIVPF
jgi:uncharacterized protein (UPF0261 family)